MAVFGWVCGHAQRHKVGENTRITQTNKHISEMCKLGFLPCGTCSPWGQLRPFLLTPPSLLNLHLSCWVFTKVKKHVFLLSSLPSHIHHSLLNSHLYLKNMYSSIFFTPPLLLAVSLSVYPTSPPLLLSLFKHFPLYHSFIRPQRGIEDYGHSAEWSKLSNAACTIGMEGMSEKKGWEEREGNCTKMESSWNGKGEAVSVYLRHVFLFLRHHLAIDFYSSLTVYLTPSSVCLHVSFLTSETYLFFLYQTLPLIPCEVLL